ncbi:hypothetical protein DFJ58DRAFT_725284 [Suillus subalutaceus]|uniref:uncharacterized protein n=1 Tax=Suillus subalutaceus TaxID=48586 RepID=UPI001B86F32F|nr:uncharacterized protein DFJ58DRAFT_725284 [Suillus subalutaceus]KAG1862805.1 hypothetical protein DFJ58DRAFT_725284 [Suillus subalutaceus]
MITGHFTRILNILKKWLSRLARRSASLFFVVLSSLRRFVAGHLKFGDRRLITRSSSGVLPRSQEDIGGEGSPICPSLLPPGQTGREATEEPPSPSDEPYTGSHPRNPRPLRKGTAIPPLDADPTTIGYTSATQTDGLHQGSVSSLHLSLHMEESSVKSKTFHKDGALQEFSSPGPSRLSGLHEVSTTHSRPRGYMDDAHSVNTTRTRSMRHLTPGMPYSQYASDSRVSVGSLTRSIAGSEVRQAAYRTHTGPVYSRPISVSSVVDVHHVHHGSPNTGSIPLDSSAQAVPLSDHGFDHHVHYTAPPGSNELPGQEVVMVYDGPPTCPIVTDNVRRADLSKGTLTSPTTTVRAMTMGPHEMNVPQGWTAFVHPEGVRYFVNQETRTFTEMNVCEPDICDDIEYFMQYLLGELEQTIGEGGLSLMKEVDLVVEPKCFDGESVVCCYYFANHRDRCLFWLDDFNPEHIISECKGIRSSSHLWFAIEAQYWCVPVKGSSAAFDVIEIKDHLSVVDKIKIHPTPPLPTTPQSMRRGHAAIVIGRIMYILTHNHFVNYHGEDCVRLNFEQSVHGWTYKPSPLMSKNCTKFLSTEVAHTARWNAFCSNFKGQLQDSNLLATVLLNANVGFLAINTVDRGGRDAIQLASYMSLVTSLGSIVLGLFFVSHSRTSGQNTAMEAAVFLGKLHNRKRGLERLAIIYSLPKALLIMAFFFAAFSTDWWTSGDITSRTIVGTVTLVILVMISNSIILTREGAKWSWRPTWRPCGDVVQGLSSRLADAWKQLMQLGQTDPTDNPRTHTDAVDLGTFVDFSAEADAQMRGTSRITTLPSSEIPGSDNHGNHPNSLSPPVRPPHPTASVDAPQQPHAGNFVLPSSDSRTNLGVLSGASSLQQIRENTQMVCQDQSTTEARCEPGCAPLCVHFDTLPSSASEGMVGTAANALRHSDALPTTATILSKHVLQSAAVATDTGAPTLPSSFGTEEREGVTYTKNVVEEPWELEHASPSTMPPPRIYARSATGDHFHHAPGAPQATLLETGHEIVEE